MNTLPVEVKDEEPLLFREVAAVTALLAFAAFSIVATAAILGSVAAGKDRLKKWGLR